MVSQKEREPLLNEDCPIRQVIDLVGGKWTLPVLYVLKHGTKRYSELQREIPGISKKMLTQTLRTLESDQILKRKVYAVVPPKTEYNLTVFGKKLIEPLEALSDWAWEHQTELRQICQRRQHNTKQKKSSAAKKRSD